MGIFESKDGKRQRELVNSLYHLSKSAQANHLRRIVITYAQRAKCTHQSLLKYDYSSEWRSIKFIFEKSSPDAVLCRIKHDANPDNRRQESKKKKRKICSTDSPTGLIISTVPRRKQRARERN